MGAAVDALRSRIAIRARDRIIHHEAVAAMQLHAFVDDAALHVRAPVFGSGRGRRRKLVLQYQLDAAIDVDLCDLPFGLRSEEHTSELQSLMRISYAVFCLKKKKQTTYSQYTPTIESI